jgi:hypothetical protein
MEFLYPNIIAGTDAWSDWWTPPKGKINAGIELYTVTFPRELAAGDVVSASMEMQFDGLVLGTADTSEEYNLRLQGPVNGSFNSGLGNIVTSALQPWGAVFADGTYSGTKFFSGTKAVEDGDKFVGTTEVDVDIRIDNCGGGRLCVRRLMVTLNGDGVPHAWAPAAGEVWPE